MKITFRSDMLTVQSPKARKGEKLGYLTAVVYMVPWMASGSNVCAMAELAKCIEACLNLSGRGGIKPKGATFTPGRTELPDNAIQRARLRRTNEFHADKQAYMVRLESELRRFVAYARKNGFIPVIRLNGTSDIRYENIRYGEDSRTIFEALHDVQFYDYTKIAKRFYTDLPDNYDLVLSYSGASPRYNDMCQAAHKDGARLVVVTRSEKMKQDWLELDPDSIDGDEHDLTFLHPKGSLILLTAKGPAKKDTSGFVVDLTLN